MAGSNETVICAYTRLLAARLRQQNLLHNGYASPLSDMPSRQTRTRLSPCAAGEELRQRHGTAAAVGVKKLRASSPLRKSCAAFLSADRALSAACSSARPPSSTVYVQRLRE